MRGLFGWARRKYHTWLGLLSSLLLASVLCFLTAFLYRDAVRDIREMLLQSAEVKLDTAMERVGGEFETVYSRCLMLNNSEYFNMLMEQYARSDLSGMELHSVYEDINEILNNQLYACDVISSFELVTPARNLNIRKIYFDRPYTIPDGPVTTEIQAYREQEGNIRFSFVPEQFPDCAIHVTLFDGAIDWLLKKCTDVAICDEFGNIYRSEGECIGKISERELREILRCESAAGIQGRCCYARGDIPHVGWKLLYTSDADEYTRAYRLITVVMLAAFLMAMLVSSLLGRAVSKPVLRTLNALVEMVKHYRSGSVEWKNRPNVGMREKILIQIIVTSAVGIMAFILLFGGMQTVIRTQHSLKLAEDRCAAIAGSFGNAFEKMRAASVKVACDHRMEEYAKVRLQEEQIDRVPSAVVTDREVINDKLLQMLRENVGANAGDLTIQLHHENYGKSTLLYSSSYLYDRIVVDRYSLNEWQNLEDAFGNRKLAIVCKIPKMECYVSMLYEYDIVRGWIDGFREYGVDVLITDALERPIDGVPLALEENQRMIAVPIENTPWYVAATYRYDSFLDSAMQLVRSRAELVICMILAAVLLGSIVVSRITSPISRLSRAVREVDKSGLTGLQDSADRDFGIDELNELGNSFVEMTSRIELLIDKLVVSRNYTLTLENEKKRAELNALQMQITPHFLANTILLISDRITSGYPEEAKEMLLTLNNLFRYGISRHESIILVNEEWEYAQAYTQIMNARKGHLRFEWSMDAEALKRNTIRLILQPLIENSIHHGLSSEKAVMTVRISCHAEKDRTIFEVEDDGRGITPDILARIRETLGRESHESGVGLSNVHSRVRLHCGEKYGLRLESEPGKGTKATVILPAVIPGARELPLDR